MAQPLYVVTGINRLTGEREACSMAAPKDIAEQLKSSWMKCRSRNKAYKNLRLDPVSNDLFGNEI